MLLSIARAAKIPRRSGLRVEVAQAISFLRALFLNASRKEIRPKLLYIGLRQQILKKSRDVPNIPSYGCLFDLFALFDLF